MSSILDVAKSAGVSKSTVSRYFNNGYVSKEVRIKIEKAINELNYKTNSIGKMFKDNSTKTIALCVPVVSHPFFALMIQAIENEAHANGYKLLITGSANDVEREKEFIDLLSHNQVDGIIFITHNKYRHFDSSLPVVTIDRHFGKNVPCITSDNYDATYKALKYLYQKGHRKIGFIGGCPKVESEVSKRYDAYLDFIKAYNLESYVYYEDFRHGEEILRSLQFNEKYPDVDALFATSDAFGFAFYRICNDINKKIDIITYDGCMNKWIQVPTFTSVRQNIEEMAKVTVDVLLRRIKKEKVDSLYKIKTEFVIGETA
ncbi:MAG: LacI family DNA-binding transcriptional regulator [Bacilli bacterium]